MSKKVIIAGGREFKDRERLYEYMDRMLEHYGEIVIVCGMAKGADHLGYDWAEERDVKVDKHPANWNKFGRGAGMRRNLEMAKCSDVLVAFWDGESKGTRGMILDAIKEGLEVHVYRYQKEV